MLYSLIEESRQDWRWSLFCCSFLSRSHCSSGGHMSESIALLIMLFIFPCLASAQQSEKRPRPPSVTANGEAVITVEPDQAQIDIGVVTQARNAPDAAKENAEKLASVMSEVKKFHGKGDEIKTARYSIIHKYC